MGATFLNAGFFRTSAAKLLSCLSRIFSIRMGSVSNNAFSGGGFSFLNTVLFQDRCNGATENCTKAQKMKSVHEISGIEIKRLTICRSKAKILFRLFKRLSNLAAHLYRQLKDRHSGRTPDRIRGKRRTRSDARALSITHYL